MKILFDNPFHRLYNYETFYNNLDNNSTPETPNALRYALHGHNPYQGRGVQNETWGSAGNMRYTIFGDTAPFRTGEGTWEDWITEPGGTVKVSAGAVTNIWQKANPAHTATYKWGVLNCGTARTAITAANITETASGKYDLTLTSHGMSSRDKICIRGQNDVGASVFPSVPYYYINGSQGANTIRVYDQPSLATTADVYVWREGATNELTVNVCGTVVSSTYIRDLDPNPPFLWEYVWGDEHEGHGVFFEVIPLFGVQSIDFNIGKVLMGRTLDIPEDRIVVHPSATDKAEWRRFGSGGPWLRGGTRHRSLDVSALLSSLEQNGESEVTKVLDGILQARGTRDTLIDVFPNDNTERAKQMRFVGMWAGHEGPIDTQRNLSSDGSRLYQWDFRVEEST